MTIQFLDNLSRAYKMTYRTVIGPFLLRIKKACREFIIFPVVVKAFTAFISSAARFIGAVAVGIVFFHLAFHNIISSLSFKLTYLSKH